MTGPTRDEKLKAVIAPLLEHLVNQEYDKVIERATASRVTSGQLARVIKEYGRTLVSLPPIGYANMDAVAVRGTADPTWSVRIPLWTAEEGRSDLTLELTVSFGAAAPSVEVDDLHVL